MKKTTFLKICRTTGFSRSISTFILLNLLAEIVCPTTALALTAGPAQPEFSSFEPVATTDLVNDFSGAFTYNLPVLNVPGPDGGGYAMSLSYHSGVSSEEEASWVGFGWTLNPGAINRNKRGFADEFKGVDVEQYNKVKPNWSQSARFSFNMEYASKDAKPSKGGEAKSIKKIIKKLGLSGFGSGGESASKDPADVSFSLSHTIRYNNYTGFSISNGMGIGVKGIANLSMNRSGAQNTFGFSVNPVAIMKSMFKKEADKTGEDKSKKWGQLTSKEKLSYVAQSQLSTHKKRVESAAYPMQAFAGPALPYSVAKNSGIAYNFSGSAQVNPAGPVGFQVGIAGDINIQVMEGKQTLKAYGYMNSNQANNGGSSDDLYDYGMEKESTFDKHDKTLGIPYNNADYFSATGNNVVGGFRLQHEKIGAYYPNHVDNEVKIRQVGVELGLGQTIQVGVDVGVGKQTTKVRGHWPKMPSLNVMAGKEFSATKPKMRFTNDPGGELNYGDNDYDDLITAKVLPNKHPDIGPQFLLERDAERDGRSSYIEYFQEADPANPTTNEMITKIDIHGKSGVKSSYGLPVYSRNEMELTVGIPTFQDGAYLATNTVNVINPIAQDQAMAIGSKVSAKYATSYLLTSNTEYNYIDADAVSGPSNGDFGGWTKFAYSQAYGNEGSGPGSSDWYRYRSPYAGLIYDKGRMLDPDDQKGSMSCGEKQVYYLKNVETKSHIAIFVTNVSSAATFLTEFPVAEYPYLYSGGQPISSVTLNLQGSGHTRYDGLDAIAIPTSGSTKDPAAEDLNAKGNHTLRRLEKIVLFAKNDLSHPVTTTFFDYNYSLCPGIPNSLVSAPADSKGKLTLRRVWTESHGIHKSVIAPYQFHYEYFSQYPAEVYNRYMWADTSFNQRFTLNDAKQNPAYMAAQLDPWGFYQEDGEHRHALGRSWVSQKNPSSAFDPAAWQLKRIQLPSGGEVHVQYEQKDYSNVQNLKPMSMVSLLPDDNQDEYTSDESVFCINATDIEVNDPADVTAYAELLTDFFIEQHNKLYFKVLYAYTGDDEPKLNTPNRRFEYATGYTSVKGVTVTGTAPNLKILLGLGETDRCSYNGGKPDKTLPRYVCYQDLLTNGGHNIGLESVGANLVYGNNDYTSEGYLIPSNLYAVSQRAKEDALVNTVAMFTDWVSLHVKNTPKKKACKEINFTNSYFKLPVFHAKKGGGVRVKRLLSYDPGIENGDAMIYGSEYLYVNEDGSSSGVATNEPASAREESALVSFVERKKQKWLPKILNGRDTKQDEGPIGENVLPGASVAHSRIIVKNIHSGKSGTGYTVVSYHTAKDFPLDAEYTTISKKDKTYKKFDLTLPLAIFNMETHKAWVTQGYIFKLNDMHGKLESKATYAGDYDALTFKEGSFVNKTTYQYSEPGEKVSSLVYDASSDAITREYLNPGTQEDYTLYMSNVRERGNDFTFEMDFNLTLPVLPSITFFASYSYADNHLCQHVTSKVVSLTSHLLSSTTTYDGVTQTTENLMFDRYTNEPVLTRTYDGYRSAQGSIYTSAGTSQPVPEKHEGYYYNLNIPAAWMYSSMGPKSENATNANRLTASAGNVLTYGTSQIYEQIMTAGSWSPTANPPENVVSASAVAFSKNWFDSKMSTEYPALSTASVLSLANGCYYPWRSYTYRANVLDANSNGRIYSGGVIAPPFKFFKWNDVEANPMAPVDAEWYSDRRITRYSVHGLAVEEIDTLGVASCVQMGYSEQLPVLVGTNAKYKEAQFVDFEYGYGSNLNVTETSSHTGRRSFNLTTGFGEIFFDDYQVDQALINRGASLKLWLHSSQSSAVSSPTYKIKNPAPQLKAEIGTKLFDFVPVAQTGEWTLFVADIYNFQGLAPGAYDVKLEYNFLTNETVLIDDFRIQPMDASVVCSVYHDDHKLAAQFDDQHFATLFEYNSKGQLVRKSIETERGRKTVQEQQYNTPMISKVKP